MSVSAPPVSRVDAGTPRPAGAPRPLCDFHFTEGLWPIVFAALDSSVTLILETLPLVGRQQALDALVECGGSVDDACGMLLS